jgi:hypothetical protein
MLAKRFYRGGFEEKMTRREAALILGVRESATPERVRDRHRKMLMLNHPDMGGSTFLAEKVRAEGRLHAAWKRVAICAPWGASPHISHFPTHAHLHCTLPGE